MSEKSKKTICPSCGAEIPSNEPKRLMHICEALRGVLEDEEVDLTDEEVLLATESSKDELDALQAVEVETVSTITVKERLRSFFAKRLMIRVGVFFLSLALLLLSFAPFVSCQIIGRTGESTISFAGADCLKVFTVSTVLLGGEFNGAQNAFTQANGKYSAEDLKEIVLTAAMEDQIVQHPTIAIATVLYILYVVICAILLLIAAKNLFSEFFTAKKNRDRQKKHSSDWLYCLPLCLLPAVVFAMAKAYQICVTNVVSAHSAWKMGDGGSLAWGAILSLVLLIAGSAFLCVARSFGNLRSDRRYFDRRRVKHMLCAFLIVLALLFSFFPCIQMFIWNPSTYEESTLNVTLWEFREITPTEWISYQNIKSLITPNYVYLAAGSEEEHVGYELMNSFLLTSPKISKAYVFHSVLEISFIVTLLVGGLFLFSVLKRGFFGAQGLKFLKLFKVLTMILVSLNLVLSLVVGYLVGFCLPDTLSTIVGFQVGTGVILSFVCILLATVLSLGKKKEIEYIDDDYDNADISYAPYVLDTKK